MIGWQFACVHQRAHCVGRPDEKVATLPPGHAQIYDLRTLRELATYQGHTRDVTCCAWHPVHEELFASGSYDGGINYWLASRPDPQVGDGRVKGHECVRSLPAGVPCGVQICANVRACD